jgi:hypothetical protein
MPKADPPGWSASVDQSILIEHQRVESNRFRERPLAIDHEILQGCENARFVK